MSPLRQRTISVSALCACALAVASCGSDVPSAAPTTELLTAETTAVETAAGGVTSAPAVTEAAVAEPSEVENAAVSTFVAEVWADNWFALSVNGELVGEDSVPITTERSFNAETVTFEASYPLTVALEAKDFKETDSGLEYIGEGNQQMGDGGLIVQITDTATGEVVAASDDSWAALVVHRAPLNVECERSGDPDTECEFEIGDTPVDWTAPSFDAASWDRATVWSEADVSPKDGYDEIDWDPSADLIWGSDLEVDNTVLLRTTIDG